MSPSALQLASYWDEFLSAPEAQAMRHLRGDGPVAAFEAAIRERCGVPYVLGITNATTGLLVLAMAFGLRRSEIIVAPNSWGGTYGPFLLTGNTLHVAEACGDGTIDALSVARLLERHPRTKAVLACDLPGAAHDAEAVRAVCREFNVHYLADLAATSGRYLSRTWSSPIADAGVLSFGPNKEFSTIEGGCILTTNSSVYRRMVRLCQHPSRYRQEFSLRDAPGVQAINARMSALSAVVGLTQLEALNPSVT